MDKYVRIALKSLGVIWNNTDDGFELNTAKDIDGFISRQKDKLSEVESLIIELKEAKDQIETELQVLIDLKHQVKTEEYKDLNPKWDIS